MKVEELIERLQKIKDKSNEVYVTIDGVKGMFLIIDNDEEILSGIHWGVH